MMQLMWIGVVVGACQPRQSYMNLANNALGHGLLKTVSMVARWQVRRTEDLFSYQLRGAMSTIVCLTTRVATVITGQVRSTQITRTIRRRRIAYASVLVLWVMATAIGDLGSVFVQYVLRILLSRSEICSQRMMRCIIGRKIKKTLTNTRWEFSLF